SLLPPSSLGWKLIWWPATPPERLTDCTHALTASAMVLERPGPVRVMIEPTSRVLPWIPQVLQAAAGLPALGAVVPPPVALEPPALWAPVAAPWLAGVLPAPGVAWAPPPWGWPPPDAAP